jgi:glycine cleavage system H protein
VIEVNPALDGNPETINQDAYEAGWMLKLKLADPASVATLHDAAAYEKLIG